MTQDERNPKTEDHTMIFGPSEGEMLSEEELCNLLQLPSGDDILDYGNLSMIGIGGLGAVFSAQEPGLNREIALKVLRPEFRNRQRHIESFIREARATAQIDPSYGLYLYAWPLQNLLIARIPGISPWAVAALALGAAMPLGLLSWFLIERPMLRFRAGTGAAASPEPGPIPAARPALSA